MGHENIMFYENVYENVVNGDYMILNFNLHYIALYYLEKALTH